ncbi:POU domain, class 6, transcription factor 2-like isoform X1 [Petromyzon marinus]|uniref:POU domain, class 6, transcription factor 2-like isoform X1 n=1 Tax=Petromyzon marinus TaxID=7757 RepID=UPI003F6FC49E
MDARWLRGPRLAGTLMTSNGQDSMISEQHRQLNRKVLPLSSSLLLSGNCEKRRLFESSKDTTQNIVFANTERLPTFNTQANGRYQSAVFTDQRQKLTFLAETQDPLLDCRESMRATNSRAELQETRPAATRDANEPGSWAGTQTPEDGMCNIRPPAESQNVQLHLGMPTMVENRCAELKEPLIMTMRSTEGRLEEETHGSFESTGTPFLLAMGTAEQRASPALQHLACQSGPSPVQVKLMTPLLLPFGMVGAGLGGGATSRVGHPQGLVLTLPSPRSLTTTAAASSGLLALPLPLHSLQATSSLSTHLQHLHQLQLLHQQSQQSTPLSSPSSTAPPVVGALGQPSCSQDGVLPETHSHSLSCTTSGGGGGSGGTCPVAAVEDKLKYNRLLASQITPSAIAAVAASFTPSSSQILASTLPCLAGLTGQLVTTAQGQIIGAIPLEGGAAGTAAGSAGSGVMGGLAVQSMTPQILTNGQGQVVATIIGNQILPVLKPQGIMLSAIKASQLQQLQGQHRSQVSPQAYAQHTLTVGPSQGSPVPQPLSPASPSIGPAVHNPQGACSDIDNMKLEEIREFARAFKIRRLSMGLTQTQVGQAMSSTEAPAYSQSAICRNALLMRADVFLPAFGARRGEGISDGWPLARDNASTTSTASSTPPMKMNPRLLCPARFEKLDITPKSAQKIKPVLERWMAEAEARQRTGLQSLSDFVGSEPSRKRRRRTSFTPQALEALNAYFERNTHPSGQEMTAIAEHLCYEREVVRVWFCNKRQMLKNTIKRLKTHEQTLPTPDNTLVVAPVETTMDGGDSKPKKAYTSRPSSRPLPPML